MCDDAMVHINVEEQTGANALKTGLLALAEAVGGCIL
jgi:hypothetical protein